MATSAEISGLIAQQGASFQGNAAYATGAGAGLPGATPLGAQPPAAYPAVAYPTMRSAAVGAIGWGGAGYQLAQYGAAGRMAGVEDLAMRMPLGAMNIGGNVAAPTAFGVGQYAFGAAAMGAGSALAMADPLHGFGWGAGIGGPRAAARATRAQAFGRATFGKLIGTTGTRGAVAGMLGRGALGLAGGAVGMGVGALAMMPFEQMATGAMNAFQGGGAANEAAFGEIVGVQSGSLTGQGLGVGQRLEMGGRMQRMAQKDIFLGMDDLTEIMRGAGQMGMFRGTRDVREFETRFREIKETVKTITRVFHTSITESLQMMDEMRMSGVFDFGQMSKLALSNRVLGGAGGISGVQVTRAQAGAAEVGRQFGFMPGGFAQVGGEQAAMFGPMLRAVGGQQAQLAEQVFGGATGFGQAMATGAGQFLNTSFGRAFTAYLRPQGGGLEVDPARVAALRSGASIADIMGGASRQLGTRQGQMDFMANRDIYGSQAAPVLMENMSQVVATYAREVFGDASDPSSQLMAVQRIMGMDMERSRVFRNMLLRQDEAKEQFAIDRRYAAIVQQRELRLGGYTPEAVRRRLGRGLGTYTGYYAAQRLGADLMTGMGGAVEDIGRSLFGLPDPGTGGVPYDLLDTTPVGLGGGRARFSTDFTGRGLLGGGYAEDLGDAGIGPGTTGPQLSVDGMTFGLDEIATTSTRITELLRGGDTGGRPQLTPQLPEGTMKRLRRAVREHAYDVDRTGETSAARTSRLYQHLQGGAGRGLGSRRYEDLAYWVGRAVSMEGIDPELFSSPLMTKADILTQTAQTGGLRASMRKRAWLFRRGALDTLSDMSGPVGRKWYQLLAAVHLGPTGKPQARRAYSELMQTVMNIEDEDLRGDVRKAIHKMYDPDEAQGTWGAKVSSFGNPLESFYQAGIGELEGWKLGLVEAAGAEFPKDLKEEDVVSEVGELMIGDVSSFEKVSRLGEKLGADLRTGGDVAVASVRRLSEKQVLGAGIMSVLASVPAGPERKRLAATLEGTLRESNVLGMQDPAETVAAAVERLPGLVEDYRRQVPGITQEGISQQIALGRTAAGRDRTQREIAKEEARKAERAGWSPEDKFEDSVDRFEKVISNFAASMGLPYGATPTDAAFAKIGGGAVTYGLIGGSQNK